MPALNIRHRQPFAALWYSSLGAFALALLVLAVGTALVTSQTVAEATSVSGIGILSFLVLLVAAITVAHPILRYLLFSFEISGQAITVNTGILFRQHESINFDRIQVIDNERGPLLMLFGLTKMCIWTASPDQYNQEHKGHLDPNPDATILLRKNDAEAVKYFMTHALAPSGGGL